MAAAAVQQRLQPAFSTSVDADRQVHNTQVADVLGATEKRDLRTVLNYFKPNEDGSPPHPTYVDRPETYDRPFESHEVTIHDVRGDEEKYTLDKNGFQIYRQAATERKFLDDEQIKASYYPETEALLKSVTGASRVFIFDHTIRRQPPQSPSGRTQPIADGTTPPLPLRGPVQRVHIDQSYSAALSRVPHHLPADADELLKGRVQIINVWRPIRTVERDPLAVADADSVSDAELVTTELIYPNRRGETYQVKHNPGHRWYYKSRLGTDEVILIKCFDSKIDGRARRVPHTAFVDTTAAEDAPTRESIEIRALVFHPDDRE